MTKQLHCVKGLVYKICVECDGLTQHNFTGGIYCKQTAHIELKCAVCGAMKHIKISPDELYKLIKAEDG